MANYIKLFIDALPAEVRESGSQFVIILLFLFWSGFLGYVAKFWGVDEQMTLFEGLLWFGSVVSLLAKPCYLWIWRGGQLNAASLCTCMHM